jgi:V8-like Glu-specific endopeptidase
MRAARGTSNCDATLIDGRGVMLTAAHCVVRVLAREIVKLRVVVGRTAHSATRLR